MSKNNKRIDWKVNRTVQETIPYHKVYELEGVIETKPKEFVRAWLIEDLNFSTAKEEDQEVMFVNYQTLMNSLPTKARIQICIINKNINKNDFKDTVLMKYRNDKLDHLREEYNKMLVDKISQGKNNLKHQKLFVVSIDAQDAQDALNQFRVIDNIILSGLRKISGLLSTNSRALSVAEHLEVLHDIYNPLFAGQFNSFSDNEKFSFAEMYKQGLSSKDIIAPDSFEFSLNTFKVGEKIGRVFYFHKYPNAMNPRVLSELSTNETNQIVSLTYTQVEQEKAISMIERHIGSLNALIIDKQKKGSKAGYDGSLSAFDLVDQVADTKEFLRDMTSRDQKLFLATGVVVIMADTMDELEKYSGNIVNIANSFRLGLRPLNFMQEQGLSQALPLGRKDLEVERTLNTDGVATFMPLNTQELSDKNGLYYGVNATSKNLLIYNRKMAKNQNGFVLGTPGSGKSFIAKTEMQAVLLNTKDEIIVVDPEAEYGALAEVLGGTVIKIDTEAGNYINPFDIVDNNKENEDPIPSKSSFITQVIETITNNTNPIHKSVIDRAVKQLYTKYYQAVDLEKRRMSEKELREFKNNITPTLTTFRETLLGYPEIEAQMMAASLESYTIGSFNLFAQKTNVNVDSRFKVYDISEVDAAFRPLAMLIMLDAIWNQIVRNREKGVNTWVYIDEMHLMFKSEETADILQSMWKRARKYGGVYTGITQNVEDLIQSSTGATMLSNSEFVLLMNQATLDRDKLVGLLSISETQSSFITSADSGHGLLYTGKSILPFINQYPKDTQMYKIMTTNFEEVNENKAEKRREELSKKEKEGVDTNE